MDLLASVLDIHTIAILWEYSYENLIQQPRSLLPTKLTLNFQLLLHLTMFGDRLSDLVINLQSVGVHVAQSQLSMSKL